MLINQNKSKLKQSSPLNENINFSTSKESKIKGMPNQPTNFLYDVILPNTLNIENIRIIKKHKNSTSPETIQKKVTQIKKSKIQSKIQNIVKTSAELENRDMDSKPKLKKYTKQNIKKQSKFQQQDQYKQFLFQGDFSIDNMKLAKYHESFGETRDRQNSSQLKDSRFATPNQNQRFDSQNSTTESPFVIEMDEKLDHVRKMQQEKFLPFKQRVMKAIDSTIKADKHPTVNALLEKVNLYISSIAQNHSKEKYKRISVDAHKRDKYIRSYCDKIQKGLLVKTSKSPRKKSITKSGLAINGNPSEAKQFRSMSSGFLKTRPHTAALSTTRTVTSSKQGLLTTNANTLSTSRLNRYTPSSAESNLRFKPSNTQSEKNKFADLLEDIENACWSSKVNTEILTKRLNKLSHEWNIDEEGYKVYENKKLDMNEGTLEMIRKMRKKANHIQKIEQQVMEES